MTFPTRVKAKISSKLSYPLGAELISSELAPTLPCMSGRNTLMERRLEISMAVTMPTVRSMAMRRP